jgi:hypothetical protein
MFGVILTQTVAEFRIRAGDEAESLGELMHFYGSLDRSMLSLFWSISGGLSWNEAMLPLEHHQFTWPAHLFVFYIAAMVFAVLNILTGVFVNTATSAAAIEQEKTTVRNLKAFFVDADYDGTGTLTYSEFQQHVLGQRLGQCLQSLNIGTEHAEALFKLLDLDQSGEVECDEFVHGCIRFQGTLKAIDFATFAVDFKGLKADLERFMQQMGSFIERSANASMTQTT